MWAAVIGGAVFVVVVGLGLFWARCLRRAARTQRDILAELDRSIEAWTLPLATSAMQWTELDEVQFARYLGEQRRGWTVP